MKGIKNGNDGKKSLHGIRRNGKTPDQDQLALWQRERQLQKMPLEPRRSKRVAMKFCPVPVCRQNCGCGGPRLVLSSDVGVGCRDGGCDSDYRLLLVIVESCDLCWRAVPLRSSQSTEAGRMKLFICLKPSRLEAFSEDAGLRTCHGTYTLQLLSRPTNAITAIRYDTIRYGRLTCAQRLTRWPA